MGKITENWDLPPTDIYSFIVPLQVGSGLSVYSKKKHVGRCAIAFLKDVNLIISPSKFEEFNQRGWGRPPAFLHKKLSGTIINVFASAEALEIPDEISKDMVEAFYDPKWKPSFYIYTLAGKQPITRAKFALVSDEEVMVVQGR